MRRLAVAAGLATALTGSLRDIFSLSQDNATPAAPASRRMLEDRLRGAPNENGERERTLKRWFAEAGCIGQNLREQAIHHDPIPNVICTVHGDANSTIVVGAHFDKVHTGHGIADNWSGAALLPLLLPGLTAGPHRHTFVLIGFSGEEKMLRGSRYYVSTLPAMQRKQIVTMINLDTLGLGPAEVAPDHSHPVLVKYALAVSAETGLPLRLYDEGAVRSKFSRLYWNVFDDSESFMAGGIPTLLIHSIRRQTYSILHSPRDNFNSIRLDDYYDTYLLVQHILDAFDKRIG
jgi:hypothetical protein